MGMPQMGGMGAAPPQPPELQAQQGLGSIANQQMPSGGQSPNPFGMLIAASDAIRAALEKLAGDDPTGLFAPFARQAISVITNGVAAVTSAPQAVPSEMSMPGPPPGAPPGTPLA